MYIDKYRFHLLWLDLITCPSINTLFQHIIIGDLTRDWDEKFEYKWRLFIYLLLGQSISWYHVARAELADTNTTWHHMAQWHTISSKKRTQTKVSCLIYVFDILVQQVSWHGFTLEASMLHVYDIGIKINKNTYQKLSFLHITQTLSVSIYHLFPVYIWHNEKSI